MSMTLGRWTMVEDPYNIVFIGDDVSFDIDVRGVAQAGTAVDDMKAKVQQLRGLMNNADESVVPVTWDQDATWDGYYRPVEVRVNDSPTMLEAGFCPAHVSMRRVAGAASAQFETTAAIIVMTNAHGVPTTDPSGIVGLPYTDLQEASIPADVAIGATFSSFLSGTSLTTDSGVVRYARTGNTTARVMRWRWYTPPAYYYDASCKFEQSYGGTYYPLHGKQVLVASNAWRISNGLVRVTVTATTIDVSHYDGSQWDTVKSWTLAGITGGPSLQEQPVVRVTKNAAHCVSVKLVVGMETSVSSTTLDITLRRGMRIASFVVNSNYTSDWYIQNSEAGTALTGGFRATSTDAAGNRYVVASPSAQTNTLASGRLKLTAAAQTFRFGIGSDVGATGSGQLWIDAYMTDISEDHRCISR